MFLTQIFAYILFVFLYPINVKTATHNHGLWTVKREKLAWKNIDLKKNIINLSMFTENIEQLKKNGRLKSNF